MKVRLVVFLIAMGLWAAGISARLYQLQIVEHETYRQRARDQQLKTVELAPPRGTIFDAKGRKLAVSVAVDSAYVMPHEVEDAKAAAEKIAGVLGWSSDEVLERLTDEHRWLWLARQLDPGPARALRELGIPGIGFVSESKRYYPLDGLAGPVLGFVGTDHSGLAGIEAAYDQVVSGEAVRRSVLRDALNGGVAVPGFSVIDAKPGADLYLTIDATVQHIVEDELNRALAARQAKAGVAVLMQPRTGAILAMASMPGFDPNRFGEYDSARWQNIAVEHAFEPGSTFKAVTAVAALERNLVDPLDVIDCEQGGITLGATRIGDHKPFGPLTFREVIAKSSNVGTIKVGLRIAPADFFELTRDFGFGSSSGIDLPGENMGILRSVERWSKWEAAYLSIGQGLSVTAVQLVRAFGALANDGYLTEPHLVAEFGHLGRREPPLDRDASGEPIASAATLRTVTRLLEAVVEEGGGKTAAVPGYRVAGKTGTAQKASPKGGYSRDRFVASFVGFVPSREPELVGLVILDEPRGLYYGGEVAAPVFGAIMARVLPYLGIAPSLANDSHSPLARTLPALEARLGRASAAPSLERLIPTGISVESGAVPDVRGLTAREAIQKLAAIGLKPKLHGSGFVETQSPPPGLPLARAQGQVEIWLGASAG